MIEVMDECRQLAAQGVTEITLIAQDTSRYGNDFEGGKTAACQPAARRERQIEGVHWVRVLYYLSRIPWTSILSIRCAMNPRSCEYLDLPLQHINARLLKRMNRRGNAGYRPRSSSAIPPARTVMFHAHYDS